MFTLLGCFTGTVFAYGVTSSGKTHTMHVSFYGLGYRMKAFNKFPLSRF